MPTMRDLMESVRVVEAVNRQDELQALPDTDKQTVIYAVWDRVMAMASKARDFHRGAAEMHAGRLTQARKDDIMEKWWEAGAPIPAIDGFPLATNGAEFEEWSRSYVGLPPRNAAE